MFLKKSLFYCLLLILLFCAEISDAQVKPTIDERIKTYVYSENEVYKLVTVYGYQSNIEFAEGEEVLTISMGNPGAFRLTPSGNRLFVKPLQIGVVTNLTIITNLHSYQFEMSSRGKIDKDSIYVMRFFYPLLSKKGKDRKIINYNNPANNMGNHGNINRGKPNNINNVPIPGLQKPTHSNFNQKRNFNNQNNRKVAPSGRIINNTNYSVSGDRTISPVKIFDNGAVTFFKFPPQLQSFANPKFSIITPSGTEEHAFSRFQGEYVAVNGIYKQMAIRVGAKLVCVFNDNLVN